MQTRLGLVVVLFSSALTVSATARPLVRPSPPPPDNVIAVDGSIAIGWGDNAVAYRGDDGLQVTVACPPWGRASSVWGDGIYTDDSSICTAAVHGGVITLGGGGEVTIEIASGQPGYPARTSNGITSNGWGAWSGSFVVVGGVPAPAPPPGTPRPIGWSDSATGLRGQPGRFGFDCPAGGTPGSVWGSGIYTDDSSICTAAVHAGAITLQRGGQVEIAIRPGEKAYPASTNHGVTTRAWGSWQGSFVIVGAPAVVAVSLPPNAISWSDSAVGYRGSDGPVTVFCPAGGSAGTVWGTSIYTDDSSVCTAAVHAGLIDFQRGGEVTLERYPGEPSYLGTDQNSVTTRSYGAWSGSFVFVP